MLRMSSLTSPHFICWHPTPNPCTGAVAEMLAATEGKGEDDPPLVLDVGAGTGLLSMMAAQAGAKNILGEALSF